MEAKIFCFVTLMIYALGYVQASNKVPDDMIDDIIGNIKKELTELKEIRMKKDEVRKERKSGGTWTSIFNSKKDAKNNKKEVEDEDWSIPKINEEDGFNKNFKKIDPNPGDIHLGDEIIQQKQKEIMDEDNKPNIARDAVKDPRQLWPKTGNEVRVPYFLTSAIENDGTKLNAINKAIQNYNEKTCIRFYKATDARTHYISVQNKGGCYSYIGRVGIGSLCRNCQIVSIGRGCGQSSIVEHEFMHALGFFHEQSRPDRGKYVRVNYGNIIEAAKRNFDIQNGIDSAGQPYDIGSVMHYGGEFFSKNGQPTIVDLKTGRGVVANRVGFSDIDIAQINAIYDCDQGKPEPTIKPPPTTPKTKPPTTTPKPTVKPGPKPFECEALAEIGMCSFDWTCDACRDQCLEVEEAEKTLAIKDIQKTNKCKKWAAKGYCKEDSKYFDYMSKRCYRTCFADKYPDINRKVYCSERSRK